MPTASELAAEIENDPQGLGYTGDNATDAGILNEVRSSIQLNRTSIPMGEIYGEVVWDPEWLGLSAIKREAFRQITSTASLDVTSQNIRDAMVEIFGAGSDTISNLQAILTRDASRAEELFGHGTHVSPSEVAEARRL